MLAAFLEKKVEEYRENDVWETRVNKTKCAVCDRRFDDPDQIVWETRTTGVNFKLQVWPIHKGCY